MTKTPVNSDDIRRLREAGWSVSEIARALRAPAPVVLHKLMTALELSDLDPRPAVHAERSEVAHRVAQGMTTLQIATELGLSRNQVRHHRIARSGELSRAREKGHRDELHHADWTGSAAADQPLAHLPVKREPGGQTKTGVKGVVTHRGRFQVTVRHRYVGIFTTLEEAALAAEAAWEVAS